MRIPLLRRQFPDEVEGEAEQPRPQLGIGDRLAVDVDETGHRPTGQRFVANPPADPATLMDLQNRESLNRPGTVRRDGERNVFTLAN